LQINCPLFATNRQKLLFSVVTAVKRRSSGDGATPVTGYHQEKRPVGRIYKKKQFFFENFFVLFCKFKKCVYLCALKQIHGLWIVKLFIASCEAANDFKCLVMVCFTER